jgi:hypothetical protein
MLLRMTTHRDIQKVRKSHQGDIFQVWSPTHGKEDTHTLARLIDDREASASSGAAKVHAVLINGQLWLSTNPDGTTGNNLDNLPPIN